MAVPWARHLWESWSIQILVLLSLGLQVALLVFAGIRRRRGAHYMLRFLLWLAYQLADYTATYALGHLSIMGAHPTVAFWAPFLLLHLGGPDNITAYSLEDTKLWKRHLLYAVLQVLGAVYVLYEHVATTSAAYASVLMFAVGAFKYVEKTRALMRSNLDTIRGSVRRQPPAMHGHFHPHDRVFKGEELDEESLVRRAHSLFHICKRAIVDYHPVVIQEEDDTATTMLGGVRLWRLMETELSLMYDMLYTKAAVIHTWFGYSVRLVSPFAIAGSLLLFIAASKDAHREADVAITYVLYGGALLMETTSLLNALGSSWTFAFLSTTTWSWLRYTALCNQSWDRLRRLMSCLHHAVSRVGGGGSRSSSSSSSRYSSRRWSRIIGQYNMLHHCCTRSQSGLVAKMMVGLTPNEWWNREHYYSWDIEMPDHVKDRISKHMNKVYTEGTAINSLGMLRNRWGEEPLAQEQVRLMTHHPRHSSKNNLWAKLKNMFDSNSSRVTDDTEELARTIYDEYESRGFSHHTPRLPYVAKLARQLLTMEEDGSADSVKLVLDVWTDILVYASNKCSRKAHAEKLNSGGELTTILWLMAEHFYQLYLEKLIQKEKINSSDK